MKARLGREITKWRHRPRLKLARFDAADSIPSACFLKIAFEQIQIFQDIYFASDEKPSQHVAVGLAPIINIITQTEVQE